MPNNLDPLRHSCSHVMADAVKRLFPDVKLAIGPAIEDGFYYDFDKPDPFKPEDLTEIEKEMAKIIKEDSEFKKDVISKKEALELFSKEPYKIELINKLEGDAVSIYRHGKFVDLCKGPHVKSTGEIKTFRLLSIAGAYWHGIETNPMLQRIYGTCFETKEDLMGYLNKIEEAKKRDHRKLGKELDLFTFSDLIGSGFPLYTPKGATIRRLLNEYVEEIQVKQDYQQQYSQQSQFLAHNSEDKVTVGLWKVKEFLNAFPYTNPPKSSASEGDQALYDLEARI